MKNNDFIAQGSDIISFHSHELGYYDVVSVPSVNDFSISVGGRRGYNH